MKLKIKYILILFLTAVSVSINAQQKKAKLKGIVKYNSSNLTDINIINKNSKLGTSSNYRGEFEITAIYGDSLLFSSIEYQNRIIVVTENHIKNKEITVYLEPGFNELDEVEILKKIRLDWGDISVEQRAVLDNDEMTSNKAPNTEIQIDPNAKFQGMSLPDIYKLFTKKKRAKKRSENDIKNEIAFLKKNLPNAIKNEYGDSFFTEWLYIPQDEIFTFLDFCQGNGLSELYKSDEILIKDFLIKQSKVYLSLKE